MIGVKLAVVLGVAVGVAFSVEVADADAAAVAETSNSTTRVAVNVNKLVDSLVGQMRLFAVDNGLDPMELPDFKKGFRVKLLLLAIHGELWLTDGVVHDFATLRREGDAVVDVKKKTIDVHFAIGFEDLIINYDYKAKLMNLGPKGGIIGTLKETAMKIDLSYDKETQVATLTKLKITHKGRLDIKFTGTILLDLVANAISDVITTLFTGVIMNIIEDKVRDAIDDALAHHVLNEVFNEVDAFRDRLL